MGKAITITGIKELDKALSSLTPKLQKKAFRKVMRPAMKMVRDAAKADAPTDTGLLRSAIKVRAGKRSQNSISVNVITGEGDYKGATFYGAFQEYGTSSIPAKGYMRRAYDTAGEPAKAQAMRDLLTVIEEIASQHT